MNPNDIFLAAPRLQQDKVLANQGYLPSAIRTGYRYYTGLAGTKDNDLARQYFTIGAKGLADASPWILYMNLQAAALNKTPPPYSAVEKLSALADHGDVIAVTMLGRVQEQGWNGTAPNCTAAKAAYLSVGPQFALAQTFLGELYLAERNFNDAESLFFQATEAGETRASVNLALIWVRNQRSPVDAKRLLKLAVQQNSSRAMYRLSILYARGVGDAEPEPNLAWGLLRRAAAIGYPPALDLIRAGKAPALKALEAAG